MSTHIVMMKLTDQGAKAIKDAPARIDDSIKTMEKMGGKLIAFYLTTGEYDYIGIGEVPNDEVLLTFLLGLGTMGTVRTTTVRAFSREELAAAVKKLP
jgi:uncharacterized protein with GYD domain